MLISFLITEMVILHNMFLLLLLSNGSSITLGVCNCQKKENYNGNFCPLADIHLLIPALFLLYVLHNDNVRHITISERHTSKNRNSIKMFFRQECHFSKLIIQILTFSPLFCNTCKGWPNDC